MNILPSNVLPVLVLLFLLPCHQFHPTESITNIMHGIKTDSNSWKLDGYRSYKCPKESLNESSPYAKCDKINPEKGAFLQCDQTPSRQPEDLCAQLRLDRCNANSTLFAGTTVRSYCKWGYRTEKSELKYSEITCDDQGKWSGNFEPCVPIKCKKFSTKNAEILCSRRGFNISDCNENSEMIMGTKVRLLCKPGYGEGLPIYFTYLCQENGEWSHPSIMSRCDLPTDAAGIRLGKEYAEKIRKYEEILNQNSTPSPKCNS